MFPAPCALLLLLLLLKHSPSVYMEMMLKTTSASVWLRSMQISILGTILGIAACFSRDSAAIAARGFFAGYSPMVAGVIGLQALGGLAVAVVVRNADNLVKGFATSMSILISCVMSSYFFNDLIVSPMLIAGAVTVVGATYMYGKKPAPKATSTSKSD
jgi:UDP-sugar transporter A1/2/3